MSIFGLGKKKDDGSNSNFSGKNGNEPSESQDNLSLIEEKKDMIKGIEDLSETSVKEVMIPRIDVDFLSIDTPQEELLAKIAESGHSRFPVYSESIDNVLGILYVKDLLAVISKNQEIDLEKLLRKAYFVPVPQLKYAIEVEGLKSISLEYCETRSTEQLIEIPLEYKKVNCAVDKDEFLCRLGHLMYSIRWGESVNGEITIN